MTSLAIPETEAPPRAADRPDSLYEVVGTQVIDKPGPGAYEAWLNTIMLQQVGRFEQSHSLGRFFLHMLYDLRPAADAERRPDLSFVSAARWPVRRQLPRTEAWAMVPDLAVDIIRTTTLANEVVKKLNEYLRAGVKQVWVVYPLEEEIHVYDASEPSRARRLARGDTLEADSLIPGLRLPLADLFVEEEAVDAPPSA